MASRLEAPTTIKEWSSFSRAIIPAIFDRGLATKETCLEKRDIVAIQATGDTMAEKLVSIYNNLLSVDIGNFPRDDQDIILSRFITDNFSLEGEMEALTSLVNELLMPK
jgi:hypothetical protein